MRAADCEVIGFGAAEGGAGGANLGFERVCSRWRRMLCAGALRWAGGPAPGGVFAVADLLGLVGQPAAYVIPEAERRLREALLQDDRVLGVEEFRFVRQGRSLAVSFLVRSVYGDLQAEVTNLNNV